MTKHSIKLLAIAGLLVAVQPAQAQPTSNKCYTPQFWCLLPGYGPVGAPCYCNTPYGPVPGIIRV